VHRTIFLIGGWAAIAFLTWKVSGLRSESIVYDPFEILGIRSGTSEKEIKSHYKKLSRKFHPDKVKLAANQTMEMVEAYFVEITKAYKSLTDETVRKNLEMYGHPDGRQEVSMGIAIPKWVVEGQHRFIILVGYCLVLGGLLPVIVGRWWFGNRIKTKDGVNAKSASLFFKSIKEESSLGELLGCLGRAFEIECPKVLSSLGPVEEVRSRLGGSYKGSPAQTLLYAHLMRIELPSESLKKGLSPFPIAKHLNTDKKPSAQDEVLLKSPMLLTSLLNIAMARNWLMPTLNAMRLHAYVTQAILPSSSVDESSVFAQLPHITKEEAKAAMTELNEPDMNAFIKHLQDTHNAKAEEVTKAGESCGRIELEDASFRGKQGPNKLRF
jgi:translocation protein SEC63